MTDQEIKDYFDGRTVYRFNGTEQELAELQQQDGNSYNYIITNGVIYFCPERPVVDPRAIELE